MRFSETIHCTSRVHCRSCRQDAGFRASLEYRYGTIVCPLGIPLGATKGFPAATPKALPAPPKCRFMEDTGRKIPDRPCKGSFVVCRNQESPIFGDANVWTSCDCNASKCKFFSE